MKNIITASIITLGLAAVPAMAQSTAPKTPSAPATSMDPAADAKFKTADKDSNGTLSGAEVNAYKANMSKIDTNKDGNVSRDEFASAVRSGVIK